MPDNHISALIDASQNKTKLLVSIAAREHALEYDISTPFESFVPEIQVMIEVRRPSLCCTAQSQYMEKP